MRQHVVARLRPDRDQDLIEALQGLYQGDVSDLVRRGLRIVLGCEVEHNESLQQVTTEHQQVSVVEQVKEQQPSTTEQDTVRYGTEEKIGLRKVSTVWKFPG